MDGSPQARIAPERLGIAGDAALRRLFESNVVGIIVCDDVGAVLEANDAFLQMIGEERRELERGAIDWRNLTPEEWRAADDRAIAEIRARGVFTHFEKEFARKDGSRVPVSLGGAVFAETPLRIISYVVDRSAIKRAEAALRRSELRFKRLADSGVLGVMSSRLSDNTIVEANDELLRITGYSRAEFVLGTIRWTDFTPDDWLPAGIRSLEELRRTGAFGPVEKEYYRKNGSRVPVLVGGALLEGSVDEIVSYALDLTEQREALLELRRSEARYRALAEASPEIIMLADHKRQMLYVNRRYTDYTGIPSSEVERRWREAIHPDDLPEVDGARASGRAYEIEYRLRRASDGVYRWHYARALPITDGSAETQWLATAMDIDDRKRAEESVRFIEKAAARLSESLDVGTTFETLLDLVVPDFGDWAVISLRADDGHVEICGARHKNPAKAPIARRLIGGHLYRDSYAEGTIAAYRTGRPQLLAHVDANTVGRAIKEEFVGDVLDLGFGTVIVLPIFAHGDVIGTITVISAGDARPYSAADVPPLEELARRAGSALTNARRYEREHRVADVLQQAALSKRLPAVDGFTFDGYYRAGHDEASIGGDWYDAILTAGKIVISVGDVAGSGLQAAVLMANVRQVMRGAAYVYPDPIMILDVADRALRNERENAMVTAFAGVIDPQARTMVYASAGHLPALLRTPGGRIVELDAGGLPLGCRSLAGGEIKTAHFEAGSCLLLYTDGLVEFSRDLFAGERRLRERFAAEVDQFRERSAEALVEDVLDGATPSDDIAVLLVGIDA
jgi:PAS domain S-box-containing protein